MQPRPSSPAPRPWWGLPCTLITDCKVSSGRNTNLRIQVQFPSRKFSAANFRSQKHIAFFPFTIHHIVVYRITAGIINLKLIKRYLSVLEFGPLYSYHGPNLLPLDPVVAFRVQFLLKLFGLLPIRLLGINHVIIPHLSPRRPGPPPGAFFVQVFRPGSDNINESHAGSFFTSPSPGASHPPGHFFFPAYQFCIIIGRVSALPFSFRLQRFQFESTNITGYAPIQHFMQTT